MKKLCLYFMFLCVMLMLNNGLFSKNNEYLAVVNKNQKWGYINKQGKTVVPFKYDGAFSFSEGLAQVLMRKKESYYYGYINKTGNLIIPYKFNAKNFFKRKRIMFLKFKPTGKQINKFGTTGVLSMPFKSRRAKVRNENKKYGYINKNGELVITYKYDRAWSFNKGLACVAKYWQKKRGFRKFSGYNWGFINVNGKTVIPFKYAVFGSFSEGVADLLIRTSVIRNTMRRVVINKQGHLVFNASRYYIIGPFKKGLAYAKRKRSKKYGYINKKGQTAISFKFDYARSFSQGLAHVARGNYKNRKFGYINKKGRLIIPYKYKVAARFSEGRSMVVKNGKAGFINKSGRLVIPFVYDYIQYKYYYFNNALCAVRKNGKWGYINKHGNTVIPFKYYYAGKFVKVLH